MPELGKVIIVDNGGDYFESNHFTVGLDTMVLSPGKNLGWTGGLHEGLKHSDSEFILFMNDDAEFERMPDRLRLMLQHFNDARVAAVGPATGTAMGRQSVAGPDIEEIKVLVGFCVLVRRSDLDAVGGVLLDWDLGDDIDLCIRFTKAGKKLFIDRRVFVYHHAFKTGVVVYGQPKKPGGWNSIEMVSLTTQRLILKHGPEAVLGALGEEAKPTGVRSITIEA
jgi:GT2 family glycosyltransferase